jgi:hypothetical protein
VYTPVVIPVANLQIAPFVKVGFGAVLPQIPRAEIVAGFPRDVTLAPSVTVVAVIEVAVGDVTVGTARFSAQIVPFHVQPGARLVVTVAVANGRELL